MDQPGDDFLAGAGLAPDQDVGVGVGHLVDAFQHPAHGGVLADQGGALGALGPVGPVGLVDHPAKGVFQGAGVERLGQEVGGAQAQGGDRVAHGPVAHHHDDRDGRAAASGSLQHREAVLAGQLHGGDADVDVVLIEAGDGLRPVGDGHEVPGGVLVGALEGREHGQLVIHQQNASAHLPSDHRLKPTPLKLLAQRAGASRVVPQLSHQGPGFSSLHGPRKPARVRSTPNSFLFGARS